MDCGFIPCFIILMVCANGIVNVWSALASISWNPRPNKSVGVVVINQACYSRLVVWINCFVIYLTVDVKLFFSVCLYWIDFHYESCL